MCRSPPTPSLELFFKASNCAQDLKMLSRAMNDTNGSAHDSLACYRHRPRISFKFSLYLAFTLLLYISPFSLIPSRCPSLLADIKNVAKSKFGALTLVWLLFCLIFSLSLVHFAFYFTSPPEYRHMPKERKAHSIKTNTLIVNTWHFSSDLLFYASQNVNIGSIHMMGIGESCPSHPRLFCCSCILVI